MIADRFKYVKIHVSRAIQSNTHTIIHFVDRLQSKLFLNHMDECGASEFLKSQVYFLGYAILQAFDNILKVEYNTDLASTGEDIFIIIENDDIDEQVIADMISLAQPYGNLSYELVNDMDYLFHLLIEMTREFILKSSIEEITSMFTNNKLYICNQDIVIMENLLDYRNAYENCVISTAKIDEEYLPYIVAFNNKFLKASL